MNTFFKITLLCLLPQILGAQWQKVAEIPEGPILALAQKGDTLLAAAPQQLYLSSNAGLQWTTTAPFTQGDDEASDILVTETAIFVSTVLDGVRWSTDGGLSWQLNNEGLTGWGARHISQLARRGDSLYAATLGSGVFVRPVWPLQAAWVPFNQQIPWDNIHSIHAPDPHTLLAGSGANATVSIHQSGETAWTERTFASFNGEINAFLAFLDDGEGGWIGAGMQGLFRSTDRGANWTFLYAIPGVSERVRLVRWQGGILAMMTKVNGTFLRTTNSPTEAWSVFTPALPSVGLGTDLLSDGGRLWLARLDGLWVLSATSGAREPSKTGIQLGQNTPNPVLDGVTHIPFALERAADVRLELYDARGVLLQRQELGRLSEGAYQPPLSLEGQAKGVYVYVLWADGQCVSRRLVW